MLIHYNCIFLRETVKLHFDIKFKKKIKLSDQVRYDLQVGYILLH